MLKAKGSIAPLKVYPFLSGGTEKRPLKPVAWAFLPLRKVGLG